MPSPEGTRQSGTDPCWHESREAAPRVTVATFTPWCFEAGTSVSEKPRSRTSPPAIIDCAYPQMRAFSAGSI